MTHRARGAPGVLVLLAALGLGAAVLQTESGCGLCLPGHDYVDIDADAVHELTLVGPGAGGNATASAVVADIADIARGVRSRPLGLPRAALSKVTRVEMQRHEGGYYIRLAVFDKPGAFAGIATRMAERGISLESIVQRGRGADKTGAPVPVVLITYATTEKLVREALDAIMADGFVAERPQSIRIERE